MRLALVVGPHSFQAVHSVADTTIPSFDPRDPLHPRVSLALTPPFRAFVHTWHTYPSLGVAITLRNASSHAPFPPPCVLQRILSICPSSIGHRGQLVGEDFNIFGTDLCGHGRSLQLTFRAESRPSREGAGR